MTRHGDAAVLTVLLRDVDEVIGALTLERTNGEPFDQETCSLCVAAADLLGPLLSLKRRESRTLAATAADALRTQAGRLLGRGHLRQKMIAVALAGFVALSTTVETDYRVSARAVVEGTVQQAIVAPQDGYIATAHARAGDVVKANDLLATLDDRELLLERERLTTERDKHRREYQQALASGDRARVSILAARVAQANAQLHLVEERLRRTQLRAPFDGVVVSGDLSQALGAPTQRGQVLFDVAPLSGYRVALQIDEHDISHLRAGQAGSVRLTGLPDAALDLRIERITPLAVADKGQNYFRVEAQLDAPPTQLRPGMEGVAKVAVDRGSLLSVWTHQLTDRLRLWAWSFGI
jgi:RND family efflux transporter MFP subunit